MAFVELPLNKAFMLFEPGPVILVSTNDGKKNNLMTISWHMVTKKAIVRFLKLAPTSLAARLSALFRDGGPPVAWNRHLLHWRGKPKS